jgi:hypothetical protein
VAHELDTVIDDAAAVGTSVEAPAKGKASASRKVEKAART